MAFQGSLKELPLPDIIQLVAASRKSGVFSIEDKGHRGKIVLRNGQIVHAEVGDLRGEEAVYELSIWPEGHFQFDADDATGPDISTIDKSNANLLMEAARRMDEWQILCKKIPSTRMVPVFTEAGASGGISFNPREWSVVRKIDERRTIEAIALDLEESPFDIAKVLYGLVGSGVVALRDDAPWLAPASLARLSIENASTLASEVSGEASDLLQNDAAVGELEPLVEVVRQSADAAAAADRLADLVRSARQTISSQLGPEKAQEFFDRVEELFEGV